MEWEGDDGQWRPFDPQTDAKVEAAYAANEPCIEYRTGGVVRVQTAKLDFGALTQTNSRSKTKRRVRRREQGGGEQ